MSSALAVVGLTYDAIDVQLEDLQIFLEIVTGLAEPPSVRGSDSIVPARAGRSEGNRVNDVLPLELRGWVCSDPTTTTVSDARESFATNRATVRALFAPDRARADLVATLEDGSQISVSARPLPGTIWTTIVASEVATVSIPLEGSDDWAVVT